MKKSMALAVAAALLLSAAAKPRDNAWTTPHVLTISDGGYINTLNPHLEQSAPVANLSELTGAWLLRWDEHNQLYPELATAVPSRANGGVSSDGRTITYHLRRGVKWSDGAPFDSGDVVFSTGVVNNPANNEGGRWDMIADVSAPDKYTVVYHLKKPYALFSEAFFSSCCANPDILPKHLLAKYPNINNVPYNSLPVGIGPFRFQRWDRDKQVVLVANPYYWRGLPKLDKIVYKIIPNRDALLTALQSHQIDMWYQFSGAYLERIQAIQGIHVDKQPSYAYDHLDFNLTHRNVADPRVRQALRLALDRQAIVDTVGHGIGSVKDSATPLNAPYFIDLGATPYDPAKANALLDQAGWKRGPDGIRAKDGVKLNLTVVVEKGSSHTLSTIDLVRRDWQKVGVALNVRTVHPGLMFAAAQQGGVINGDSWDVVTFAWAADPLGDYSGNFGCNQFPPNGGNTLRWCNKPAQHAMDALVEEYDPARRKADLEVVMREVRDDAPMIVLSIRVDMFAYNRDLENYHPNSLTIFDNMMDVDI